MKQIDSINLYNAYMNGADYVMQQKTNLNKINVFPVADGDTGSNLYATMRSIINDSKVNNSIKDTLESIADASLSGARGNSGIIFSQFLNGLSIEMNGEDLVTMEEFAIAHKNSIDYAYKAVETPVEGTMLTVIKDWANSLFDFHKKAEDFHDLLAQAYSVLENSLRKTKEQLNILKRAGVVDSGAKGFVIFMKGFIEALRTGERKAANYEDPDNSLVIQNEDHLETQFRYCVEAKIKGCSDTGTLLKSIGGLGDSLIVAGNQRVARVHVHTNSPDKVFDIISLHEEIISQKIDDMKMQSEIVNNRKYEIAVVTDSIADLPQDFIDDYQIQLIPINILMGGKEYLDKLSVSNEKVIEMIESGIEFPTSSQPVVKNIENTFIYLLEHYSKVIAITVASELSGTYNAFKKAAENVNEYGNVYVIDSKLNSGAQGLLVANCAKLIAKNFSYDETIEKIEKLRSKIKIIVSVSNLTNMIKGGRLGTTAGKIAQKLNMKPIVTLDKNGKGTLGGAAFSQKGSQRKIIKKVEKLYKENKLESYSIIYIDDEKPALEIAEEIEKITGMKPEFFSKSSSVIAISAGTGALAVSFIEK